VIIWWWRPLRSPCNFLYTFNKLFFLAEEALERDNFLSPEEAKEFGLIDRVLSHPPGNNDSNLQEKTS
jgi:ATP-dependent Clp protease protease subunit